MCVFVLVTVVMTFVGTTVARLPVEQIPADAHGSVAAHVPAETRIEGSSSQPVVGPAEQRPVVAAEQPAADFAVDLGRQHYGYLDAIVVERVVQKCPVRKRPVGEIVAVRVLLVEIAEGPERPPRLDPHALAQPGTGQGLDIGFLELDLRRFARVRSETEGQAAAKLVVDIAGSRYLTVAEGEALRRALRLVTHHEARYRRLFGREAGVPAVEDDADRRVERIIRRRLGARGGRSGHCLGRLRSRLERRELRLKGFETRFVILLQSLDLCCQGLRAGRSRRLGAALDGNQQGRQHDRGKAGNPDALAHCTLLQAMYSANPRWAVPVRFSVIVYRFMPALQPWNHGWTGDERPEPVPSHSRGGRIEGWQSHPRGRVGVIPESPGCPARTVDTGDPISSTTRGNGTALFSPTGTIVEIARQPRWRMHARFAQSAGYGSRLRTSGCWKSSGGIAVRSVPARSRKCFRGKGTVPRRPPSIVRWSSRSAAASCTGCRL